MLSEIEQAVTEGSRCHLWHLKKSGGDFVCTRSLFTIDEWADRERLGVEIAEAVQQCDSRAFESLDARRRKLGHRFPTESLATSEAAVAYFTQGNAALTERALQFIARSDKSGAGFHAPPQNAAASADFVHTK